MDELVISKLFFSQWKVAGGHTDSRRARQISHRGKGCDGRTIRPS